MTRELTNQEIQQLTLNLCSSLDWGRVLVPQEFCAEDYRLVNFVGDVKLGVNNIDLTLSSGLTTRGGIYNATIHNCTIGNNTYIHNIGQSISNYNIGDDCVIDNVGSITMSGTSRFGNGTAVAVLNEGGGREVLIYDNLSSQLAYFMAIYRHNESLVTRLEQLVGQYAASIESSFGSIGSGVRIENCKQIIDVKIGSGALLSGVSRLKDGTIISSLDSPTTIGDSVVADHFIVLDGSSVSDGAILDRCFVGQGCQIGKQFSAENCLFFANSVAMHGEACSLFGGPYTVTHHKSTLLIATMVSFYNAGSGTNQSNHMYKLGALHQGVLERGSKCGSNSYILYPAKIGAFSSVLGSHHSNPDTSSMPFSYLLSQKDSSHLVPGANLRSVGTMRDAAKWEKRDSRKESKLDRIIFDMLNPFTISKIVEGLGILEGMDKSSSEHRYNGCIISKSAHKRGVSLYKMAVDKFIGDVINKYSLEEFPATNTSDMGEWVDIAGLIAPKSSIDSLIQSIVEHRAETLSAIEDEFGKIYDNYSNDVVVYAASLASSSFEESVELWRKSSLTLADMLLLDAKSEFSGVSRIGYGVDGDDDTNIADFQSVRGKYEDNSFIQEILELKKNMV